jgi:hypothetical protein
VSLSLSETFLDYCILKMVLSTLSQERMRNHTNSKNQQRSKQHKISWQPYPAQFQKPLPSNINFEANFLNLPLDHRFLN